LEEVGNTVRQGADPVYLNQLSPDSLRPDPVRHSAHIVLQTDTSIPLEIAMRLQIILQVKGLSHDIRGQTLLETWKEYLLTLIRMTRDEKGLAFFKGLLL
jgi:hypothetical protein